MVPPVDRAHAEDGLTGFGAAGAHEPRETNQLAGADVEADVRHGAASGQVLDLEHDVAGCHRFAALEEDVTADHEPDELVLGRGGDVARAGDGTVLQHGHAVAELEDLGQAMADVDDGDTRAAQAPQDVEETVALGQGE